MSEDTENTESGVEQFKSCLGGIVIMVASIALMAAFNGVALMLLWRWFVVPTFSVPVLTLWSAVGIVVLINLVTTEYQYGSIDNRSESEVWYAFFYKISAPTVAIIVGYIVQLLS